MLVSGFCQDSTRVSLRQARLLLRCTQSAYTWNRMKTKLAAGIALAAAMAGAGFAETMPKLPGE